MWTPGDAIVLRYRKRGCISWATPVRVIEDAPECVALYMAAETPRKRPVQLDGTPIPRSLPYEERHALPWRLGDTVWRETAVLMLTRPGAAHSFWAFWRGVDWSFRGWYVNLQAPLRRTAVGFDSEDHLLDVVVAPDLSWAWKDEDEFAAAQRIGRFSPDQATAIRTEGEAAIRAIERRAWPFDAGWESWRPDPSWAIPTLPAGWDAG
ncbi:MAG: DUF402 domain-containing protein [Thermomicrobiales bacterium]